MSDNTYNGWSNYQTWVVNLWLDNDPGSQKMVAEMAQECMQEAIDNDESDIRPAATYELSKRLKSLIDEMQEMSKCPVTGMFADLLGHAIGMCDFYEIAKSSIDEISLYSVGSNIPGYMPDSEPSIYCDYSDASCALSNTIDRDCEDMEAGFNDMVSCADNEGRNEAIAEEYNFIENVKPEFEKASLAVLKQKAVVYSIGFTIASRHYFLSEI